MSMMDHDISPSWNSFAPPDLIGMLNRRYSPFNSRQTKEQRGKNNDRESPYNGIETPAVWPPQHIETDSAPLPVPYLNNSLPVIPIDTGRLLFVDDFLIEHSTLRRIYHSAESHESSPVLVPETELECNRSHCPVRVPLNDEVWYDPEDNRFKM